MVSTHLKNIRQNGNLPQIGVNMKKYLKPPPSVVLIASMLHSQFRWARIPRVWKLQPSWSSSPLFILSILDPLLPFTQSYSIPKTLPTCKPPKGNSSQPTPMFQVFCSFQGVYLLILRVQAKPPDPFRSASFMAAINLYPCPWHTFHRNFRPPMIRASA